MHGQTCTFRASLTPFSHKPYKWVEVWYDDWETLAVKYALAKSAGARGVGFWTADATLHNAVRARLLQDFRWRRQCSIWNGFATTL